MKMAAKIHFYHKIHSSQSSIITSLSAILFYHKILSSQSPIITSLSAIHFYHKILSSQSSIIPSLSAIQSTCWLEDEFEASCRNAVGAASLDKGRFLFHDPDSHSLYRQKQIGKHGEQRVVYQRVVEDYSEPPYKQQDVGEPSQYLPSAVTDLRTRGLFQKWERRVDADGELRTYREFRDKYQTSRYGGQWEVGFRWEEARSRSISWRLRMSTFKRRLLKPIGWAVATKFEGCDLLSRQRTVYYERAGSQLGKNF